MIYDYKCNECGRRFENESSMHSIEQHPPCTVCQSVNTKKLLNAPKEIYVDHGWNRLSKNSLKRTRKMWPTSKENSKRFI